MLNQKNRDAIEKMEKTIQNAKINVNLSVTVVGLL